MSKKVHELVGSTVNQTFAYQTISGDMLDVLRPPEPSFITYLWRLGANLDNEFEDTIDLEQWHSITLYESRTVIERGTTGLRTWLASLVLAQYLAENPGTA
jgi:hypothetical protein